MGDWSWQLFAWQISTIVPPLLFFFPPLESFPLMADGCTNRILSREFFSKNWTTIVKTMVENYGRQVRFHLRAASLKSPSTYHWPSLESRFVFIVYSRLSANSFRGSQRFHKDEPTILSHPLVFSREKPPWCNPLAPSPPPPLFPRVETKTDGLPAAAPPPRARKHVYAALRDPRRIHPTRLSSTRSPFLPFFRRRTIYRSRSIRPSRL